MNQRLAVAIEEVGKEERVAEHFGRCTKFNVCEFDDQNKIVQKETYFNPLAGEHGGVCQLPGYVKQYNVGAIIAGGMGQKAVSNFLECNINVFTAPGILYQDALTLFIQGKLSGYKVCEQNHHRH